MALNRNTLNPLSVLNLRKVSFIPDHFSKIIVDNKELDINLLDHWINYHLNSRYAIIKRFIVDSNNKMKEVYEIGVEDKKELTMLTLGCSYLHK